MSIIIELEMLKTLLLSNRELLVKVTSLRFSERKSNNGGDKSNKRREKCVTLKSVNLQG